MYSSKPQLTLLLSPGHKIGKPSPLFAKIEQSTIDELKQKYAGAQQATETSNKPSNKFFSTIQECEQAITDQGNKVKLLKASADKSVWQPEVNILLELKKQLISLQTKVTTSGGSGKKDTSPAPNKPIVKGDTAQIKELEDKITKQVNTFLFVISITINTY